MASGSRTLQLSALLVSAALLVGACTGDGGASITTGGSPSSGIGPSTAAALVEVVTAIDAESPTTASAHVARRIGRVRVDQSIRIIVGSSFTR